MATDTVGNQTGFSDEFSVYALFMRADIIVKAVLGILIFASFWSWAIIVDKSLKLAALNRDLENEANCSSNVVFTDQTNGRKACVPPSGG